MKIDRMIGILSILLQKECVTAPEIAQTFEVSRRTIMRDVDSLCRAGIPIVTRRGANGGPSIMPGYAVSSTLLTGSEMQEILTGLRSLDSVSGGNHYKLLMEKLHCGSSVLLPGSQSMLIDLSSWYKPDLSPKIQLIRQAIEACREITFTYHAPSGETQRRVEPYYLVFQWSSWYVWGWCAMRKSDRLFKLSRLTELALTDTRFARREDALPDLRSDRVFPPLFHVKALFRPECKWKLMDEYGSECFHVQPDGQLLFECDTTSKENMLAWLMIFRDQAVLLEPEEWQSELIANLRKTLMQYEQTQGGTHALHLDG